jgi:uncharacterized protein YhaN
LLKAQLDANTATATGDNINKPSAVELAARIAQLKAQLRKQAKAVAAAKRNEDKLARQLAKNQADAAAAAAETSELRRRAAEQEATNRNVFRIWGARSICTYSERYTVQIIGGE